MRIWLVLHHTVTRNHGESGLEELRSYAEEFLDAKQPFKLKLPKAYTPLMEFLGMESVQISCEPI